MYLLNKKQQKTDRKIGVFAEAPPAGAWIEIYPPDIFSCCKDLKPLPQGRELKCLSFAFHLPRFLEAPPAGAWIEITNLISHALRRKKPLPQGRELKSVFSRAHKLQKLEAPPAGAWIEMLLPSNPDPSTPKPLPQGRELKLKKK